jgi:hypothetical protein
MKLVLLAVVLTAANIACSVQPQPPPQAKQDAPCAARFVPVGNNPDIALDTQTGALCRTVAPDPKNPDKYSAVAACSKSTSGFAEWKKMESVKEWQAERDKKAQGK